LGQLNTRESRTRCARLACATELGPFEPFIPRAKVIDSPEPSIALLRACQGPSLRVRRAFRFDSRTAADALSFADALRGWVAARCPRRSTGCVLPQWELGEGN